MTENITRIADLPPPENITMQMPVQQGNVPPGFIQGAAQNAYIPMNVHQNPYGHPQPDVMANPQYQNKLDIPYSNKLTPEQQNAILNYPTQQLPSRDIPQDTTDYTHDLQTRANYIPSPSYNKDYIKEHEDVTEEIVEKHKKQLHRERLVDTIINVIQTPVFISILYFIFQMPIINTLLYKFFKGWYLYKEDGNMNMYGLLFKSGLFGVMYYSSSNIIDYISEL